MNSGKRGAREEMGRRCRGVNRHRLLDSLLQHSPNKLAIFYFFWRRPVCYPASQKSYPSLNRPLNWLRTVIRTRSTLLNSKITFSKSHEDYVRKKKKHLAEFKLLKMQKIKIYVINTASKV